MQLVDIITFSSENFQKDNWRVISVDQYIFNVLSEFSIVLVSMSQRLP